MTWDHRDPFDRIIAATAITRGLVLVSTDAAFNALGMPKWPGLVW
jgi:PIN domain nuclease of toxin-antitoxin system